MIHLVYDKLEALLRDFSGIFIKPGIPIGKTTKELSEIAITDECVSNMLQQNYLVCC